ncbi:hypothetical protein KEM52_001716 [Ascosphaera acerosa]|nr:hypothetical protein KEM52_001716 [Ascosphaera acerosa]
MEPAIPVAARLRSAIIANDLLLVKRILRNNPSYLQNPDFEDNGNTSLHLAAIMGHLDIIRLLVESGHESSGAHDAIGGEVPRLDAGMSAGRDAQASTLSSSPPFSNPPPSYEVSLNESLATPLHLAAAHSHPACVQYLCEQFSRTIDRRDDEGMTPLMHAVRNANPCVHVPQSTILVPPRTLPTPQYTYAASNQYHQPQSRKHAGSGASNISIQAIANVANAAAAAASVAAEDTSTIAVLLQCGADANAVDFEGNSPLHGACAWGNLKSFRLLLGAGAKPNAINRHGFIPLDYAVTASAHKYCRSLMQEFELQQTRPQQLPHAAVTPTSPGLTNQQPSSSAPASRPSTSQSRSQQAQSQYPAQPRQSSDRQRDKTNSRGHNQRQLRTAPSAPSMPKASQAQAPPLHPPAPMSAAPALKQTRSTPKLRIQTSTTDLKLSSASATPVLVRSTSRSPPRRFRSVTPSGTRSATDARPSSPDGAALARGAPGPASAVV